MNKLKRTGLGIILLLSLLAIWQIIAGSQFLNTPLIAENQPAQVIELKPGTGMYRLRIELQKRGLLTKPFYFEILAKVTGLGNKLRAGEFELKPGIKPLALLQLLTSTAVVQHGLTLVEGWNIHQVLAALAKHPAIEHTVAGLSLAEIKQRLAIPEPFLEGLFFPDTYHFTKGTTDIIFLRRAYDHMQKQLTVEWANRAKNLPYQTPYEALIAASLIEKEAKLPEDRPLISGVMVKRLHDNMRLQIDASVIYGLGDTLQGQLRRRDFAIDTPYNTYIHKGLPPTPIANPGLASINAALHPTLTNNIYYVADGSGGHQFSETLADHNKATQQYFKNRVKPPGHILTTDIPIIEKMSNHHLNRHSEWDRCGAVAASVTKIRFP